MYLSIKIHQSWKEAGNNVPEPILHEIRPCTEREFDQIRAQYERREGKYGMNNSSLDHCHWITEDMASYRAQYLKQIKSEYTQIILAKVN
jgi:hypothetical protein